MDGLTRTIRLLIGLGMIGAGATLAAPAGLELAAWWQAGSASAPGPLPPPPARSQTLAGELAEPVAAGAPTPPPAGPAPRSDVVPPPPPARLPPVAGGPAGAEPGLQGAYRSTLDVPPPPLRDAQRPPPVAVGWTARGTAAARTQPPQRPGGPAVPSRWRVRDGDDLNAIANRVYGTPLAAPAIWQANRGIIPDPSLLPIGAEILLPPASAVWPSGSGQASIEPADTPAEPAGSAAVGPGSSWLRPGPVSGAGG
jgi:nucleoid-associated protein YgaU